MENLPFALLSVPLDWLLPFATFRGLWAVYIQSNVQLSPGPLGDLLGAPEFHHVHHECEKSGRKNFANLNPLMDWLFGTLEKGRGDPMPLGRPLAERLTSHPTSGTLRQYLAELRSPDSSGAAPL